MTRYQEKLEKRSLSDFEMFPGMNSSLSRPVTRSYKAGMSPGLRALCPAFATSLVLLYLPASAQSTSAPADPKPYLQLGESDASRGDLTDAVAAFSGAIKADPKLALAYEDRGFALWRGGHAAAAIADYTQAIRLNPDYLDAYHSRAVALGQIGDIEGAISDARQMTRLAPTSSYAYHILGMAEYLKGDLTGAMADDNKAIALDTQSEANADTTNTFFNRGLVKRASGDKEGAASDFKESARRGYGYAAIWLWITQMEQHDSGTANGDLSSFLSTATAGQTSNGVAPISAFLLGQSTADDLLAQVGSDPSSTGRVCQASFYIGISKKFVGDPIAAQQAFQKAVSTHQTGLIEYVEAQRELATAPTP